MSGTLKVDIAGLIGASAEVAEHAAALESHAVHIDTAARLFDDMERRNAAELRNVTGPADL